MAMLKQDDELDKLEEDIRVLKNKYDQFFAGIQKMPPLTDRRRVEAYIQELHKAKIRDNSRRFRFNTLTTRFNQFREMWGRRMREREEGPMDFKRRQAALSEPVEAPLPPRPAAAAAARVTSNGSDPYVKVSPGTNGEEVRRLYSQIESENRKLGKAAGLTLEQLTDMVTKQTEMVRSRYNVATVGFRVETVDGKVKLKAKPIQE